VVDRAGTRTDRLTMFAQGGQLLQVSGIAVTGALGVRPPGMGARDGGELQVAERGLGRV